MQFKTFKRLLSYLPYTKWKLSLGVICLIISAALTVYTPYIAKLLIDDTALKIQSGEMVLNTDLLSFVAYYLLIVILGAVFGYLAYILMAYSANQLSKIIRDQAHEQMQKLPVAYFDDKPAGKISARIVNDTEVLRQSFYQNFTNQLLINLMMVIGIYVALILISPLIGLTFTLLIPLFIGWQILYMKKITPINTRWRETVSELNSQTAEIIQGVSIVQAFGRQDSLAEEFDTTNDEWYDSRLKSIKIDATTIWSLSDLLKNLALLFVLTYLGSQYVNGVLGMSVGTLYVIINYATRLFDPITNIVRLMTMLQQALVAGKRVFELIDQPVEEDQTALMKIQQGQVDFKQVSFAYKEDFKVLHDIDFQVAPGQTVGLVGHTGSGKSSIINLLFRFYDPQEGQIVIDGQDISNYSRESVRQDMGIVLQEPYLFTGTVASNISMNDPKISHQDIYTALEQVGALEMIEKFPQGIDEAVVEKGQSLSSGERQLISFARTLAANPKILILDEATSHIDTATEEKIQHAMKVIQKGRTSFIIAHRLSTIQHADLILLLEHGHIRERGRHEELMALNGQYAEMFRMQARLSI